jgi:NitT/TauT family transport system substrate-binding protein
MMDNLERRNTMKDKKRFISNFTLSVLIFTLSAVMLSPVSVSALEKIKLGYAVVDPGFSEIEIWLAKDSGMFEKEGLDVEIIMLNGDNLGLNAIITDNVDIINFSNTLNYTAIAEGAKLKILVETTPVHDYVMVTNEKIQKWDDFIDRSIAISRPGSIVHVMAIAALKRHGVDPSKVQFLPVGGSGARKQALIAKKVDGGLLHVEDAVVISKQPGIHSFSNLAKEIPEYQFVNFVVKDKTIAKRRDALTRFTKALLLATRIVVKDKERAIKVYRKYHPEMDYETVSKVYDQLLAGGLWAVNGGMSRASYYYTQNSLLKSKQLKALIPYYKAYETSIVDDVLKEIGVVVE